MASKYVRWIQLTFLVIITLAAIIFLSRRPYVSQNTSTTPLPTITPPPPIDTQTNIFENKYLGIRFLYPKEWSSVVQIKSPFSFMGDSQYDENGQWSRNNNIDLYSISTQINKDSSYESPQIGLTFAFNTPGRGIETGIDGEIPVFWKKFDPLTTQIDDMASQDWGGGYRVVDIQRIQKPNVSYIRYFYAPWENGIDQGWEPNYQGEVPPTSHILLRYIVAGKHFDSLKLNPSLEIEIPSYINSPGLEIKVAAEKTAKDLDNGIGDPKVLSAIKEYDQLVESIELY